MGGLAREWLELGACIERNAVERMGNKRRDERPSDMIAPSGVCMMSHL